MDRLLCDGNVLTDCCGRPVMVAGTRALLQRVALRLTVRRGNLPGAPDFGSRLHRIRTHPAAARESDALTAVREALAPMREVEVRGVDCRFDPAARRLTVVVRLACAGQGHTLEVTI